MKKTALLLLSTACLGFTFVKDFDLNALNIPQEIDPAPDQGTANKGTDVPTIVSKAQAFKTLLTASQQSTLQLTYTPTLARKWSNLPCGGGCRNGIQFGTLSSAQLTAALELIKAALSTDANDGFAEFEANRMAEAYLHANGGGSGYDSTLRWIAFLNEPSATGAWMLQFGGHHYAANIAFNGGHVIGATPFFQGLEPKSFTYNGNSYAPLDDEHNAFTAMLASLSSAQLTTAKLTTSFSDVLMSPGESNGNTNTFPATKQGLACSTLTNAQKSLVLSVIQHYTQDMDAATAAAVYSVYANEIDQMYVAYTGNGTSGNASSFLTAQGNYARIDGPTVWIEFSCQNGVVISGQIHYHTVWRDHVHDYGVDLAGAAIDGASSGVASVPASGNTLAIYPNPAQSRITVSLPGAVQDATVVLTSGATGQRITLATHRSGAGFDYDISRLPAGVYLLQIEEGGSVFTGRFSKL